MSWRRLRPWLMIPFLGIPTSACDLFGPSRHTPPSAPQPPSPPSQQERYVRFVTSLRGAHGLVFSRPGDSYSSGWKNALVAMILLHEGSVVAAREILDVFRDYQ